MKIINLCRIWEILNLLYTKQTELSEQGVYVYLLGNKSEYTEISFENFLEYYSFKVGEEYIQIFNDDLVPYENYNNNDFNRLPIEILDKSDDEINIWAEKEIKKQLEQQEKEKQIRKENLKKELERLSKEYNKF